MSTDPSLVRIRSKTYIHNYYQCRIVLQFVGRSDQCKDKDSSNGILHFVYRKVQVVEYQYLANVQRETTSLTKLVYIVMAFALYMAWSGISSITKDNRVCASHNSLKRSHF